MEVEDTTLNHSGGVGEGQKKVTAPETPAGE